MISNGQFGQFSEESKGPFRQNISSITTWLIGCAILLLLLWSKMCLKVIILATHSLVIIIPESLKEVEAECSLSQNEYFCFIRKALVLKVRGKCPPSLSHSFILDMVTCITNDMITQGETKQIVEQNFYKIQSTSWSSINWLVFAGAVVVFVHFLHKTGWLNLTKLVDDNQLRAFNKVYSHNILVRIYFLYFIKGNKNKTKMAKITFR